MLIRTHPESLLTPIAHRLLGRQLQRHRLLAGGLRVRPQGHAHQEDARGPQHMLLLRPHVQRARFAGLTREERVRAGGSDCLRRFFDRRHLPLRQQRYGGN